MVQKVNPYQTPATDAAPASEAASESATKSSVWFDFVMLISAVLASLLVLAILANGMEEPFYGDLNPFDALIFIGGGGIGIAFSVVWSFVIMYAVYQRWWKPIRILLLLFALLVGLVSLAGISEYLHDRQEWRELSGELIELRH